MGKRARKNREPDAAIQSDSAPQFRWWLAGLLILTTIAAYFPAMRAGYIWDDDYYVTNNLPLRSADGLVDIWFKPSTEPQYYPLTHSTFWLEYHLWGKAPAGYHIDNVLLHCASAIILWRLLMRLKVPGAAFVAALFAVHPVGVESVAWVTERKNVLSCFFYLLAATYYWRAIGEPDEGVAPSLSIRPYVAAMLLFLCALLSKTVASTMPAAMLLVVWWKRGRLRVQDFYPAIPLLLLGIALGLGTAMMERTTVGAVGPDWDFSFADRLLIAGRALWFYVGKLLWPANLTFIYPRWSIEPSAWWQWLFPAAAAVSISALLVLRKRIGRGPVTAALFFAGTLVPALGFFNTFPMLYSFVADHFQYVASIGVFALVCGAALSLRLPPRVLAGAGVCAIIACALLTFQQTRMYRDERTLWEVTLERNPGSWMASSNLAKILIDDTEEAPQAQRQQAAAKARTLLECAIAGKPNNPTAIVHLGSVLSILGDEEGAVAQWQKVMDMQGQTNPQAWPIAASNAQVMLGRHYLRQNDPNKAAEHFAKALELQSGNVYAMTQYATLLAGAGQYEQANRLFQEAAERSPDSPHIWVNIGNFQFQSGHAREAIASYEHAIALDPGYLKARYGKAIALAADGQLAAAETDLRDLAREHPDSADVLASLGTVLAKTGRIDEARACLQQALQIQPGHPQATRQLRALDVATPQ